MTNLLAIYAAILSTFVFVWNVYRSQPRANVQLVLGVEHRNEQPLFGVYALIQNSSAHTVHIGSIEALYPWRTETLKARLEHMLKYRRLPIHAGWCHSYLVFDDIDTGLPTSIEPGRSHRVFIPDKQIEDMLERAKGRKFKVVVQDELWRNMYSKSFTYDGLREKNSPE